MTKIGLRRGHSFTRGVKTGVDLYFLLALASRTGNLRKLPVRKRTYLPQFLGGHLKHKNRVAKGKNNRFRNRRGLPVHEDL